MNKATITWQDMTGCWHSEEYSYYDAIVMFKLLCEDSSNNLCVQLWLGENLMIVWNRSFKT